MQYKKDVKKEVKKLFKGNEVKNNIEEPKPDDRELQPIKSKARPKRPLSEVEQIFFYSLARALPHMNILPQVALSRFLYPQGESDYDNNRKYKTYSEKTIDYLICDKSFYIKVAIEIDDSSHTPKKDEEKNALFKESGIKLIRWHVKSLPSEAKIQQAVFEK